LQERRIWLDLSNEDETSGTARLANIAGAISATTTGRPALLVRLSGSGSFVNLLAAWASGVESRLDFAERETALGRAVRQLSNHDLEGLEILVGIQGIVAIFSLPPRADDATAWAVLEGAPSATIVIGYFSTYLSQRAGWKPDRLEMEAQEQIALDALKRFPKTLALLSVLDGPANLRALSSITGEISADIAGLGLTIAMPSGVVLSAGARSTIRERLPPSAIAEAHRCAFEGRRRVPALIESDDAFAVVRDLVGSNASELPSFVNALASRQAQKWTSFDWIDLSRALQRARDSWPTIDSWVLLEIASALVSSQELRRGGLWLDALETKDPEQKAWRHFLQSEIEKANGTASSEARMWDHARLALQYLDEAISSDPNNPRLAARLREMRINIARLQLYFKHDAEAARTIFATVLDELNLEPEESVGASLVATLRNLAECLFEFEPFKSLPDSCAQARAYLVRATSIAQRQEKTALGAEAMYSLAKLDETQAKWPAAHEHLNETIRLARLAGHTVCLRIAEMRTLWLQVDHENVAFDYTIFAARLRKLEFVEWHAWARRYAALSRLRAAHLLEKANDHIGMQSLLERTIASFEPIAKLASGADRRAVALAFAGLSHAEATATGGEARAQRSWESLQALPWAGAWKGVSSDPSELWRGDA
jgi:hypothetical protein